MIIMGRKSKLKLSALKLKETFGQRLASIRKAKGYTQTEIAKKTGLTQGLISDYELDKLRPYHEVIIRFALALDVQTDELLGLKDYQVTGSESKPASRLIRRMKMKKLGSLYMKQGLRKLFPQCQTLQTISPEGTMSPHQG
jgi:transcriptional regulator with XRE-family HTH domain